MPLNIVLKIVIFTSVILIIGLISVPPIVKKIELSTF